MKTLLIFILTEMCLATAVANCATAQTPSQMHPNKSPKKYIHGVSEDLYNAQKKTFWEIYEKKRQALVAKCDAKKTIAKERFQASDPSHYAIYSNAHASKNQAKVQGIEAILRVESRAFVAFEKAQQKQIARYERGHAKLHETYTAKESELFENFSKGIEAAQKSPY